MKTKQLLEEVTEVTGDLGWLLRGRRTAENHAKASTLRTSSASPSIIVITALYGFTKDHAIVRLDKEEFMKSSIGNILDLRVMIILVRLTPTRIHLFALYSVSPGTLHCFL